MMLGGGIYQSDYRARPVPVPSPILIEVLPGVILGDS